MEKRVFIYLSLGAFLLACPPKVIDKAPDKILHKNGWSLKIWVTAKGTRSEGQIAHLYHYGKEVCPKNGNYYLTTPLGKLLYKENRFPWGWHGWKPIKTDTSALNHINIAGKWQTNFGVMHLHLKDNFYVTGSYTHDSGKLRGKLIGNRLHCTWSEAPSYRPPKDAGDCLFIFSPNGRSFSGKWRYGFGTGKWDGNWSGYKE